MILTLYYMYATLLQWWRLGTLRNKLNGTLNTKNALLLSRSRLIHSTKRQRSIETLLFHADDRIACTILPKQTINLAHWVLFPKDPKCFPIHIEYKNVNLRPPYIYLMLKSFLEYYKHESEAIQIEDFGELMAWKATANKFEVIIKTDLENLTKLIQCYYNSIIDINHDLEMIELETVNIDGNASRIQYNRKYSTAETLKFSYAPVHWKKFVGELKELYQKIRENSNPKIKIENGSSKVDDHKKVPVYEVKPMKKENQKTEDKHTLDVSGTAEHRRHKTQDKKEKNVDDKPKTDRKAKEDPSSKAKEQKTETSKPRTKSVASKSEPSHKGSHKRDELEHKLESKSVGNSSVERQTTSTTKPMRTKKELERGRSREKDHSSKESKKKSRSRDGELDEGRRDKQPVVKVDKCDEETNISVLEDEKNGSSSKEETVEELTIVDKKEVEETVPKCDLTKSGSSTSKKLNTFANIDCRMMSTLGTKPPNILVYADTITAKENVKAVLGSVINGEKYIVYDLPTNISTYPAWCDSTALVVICGATTPDVTSQLLHYLVGGGRLLCLCSDLLHSILSVFSTAEVREHELVRFSYGEWKRVKMMHHIFCYQASPAKKQFSQGSVESNNHSNGSSPIAPRTPSIAEIQHNGKNYTLQVQVLGTEETWQTPSLLLANVKNSNGRAIFSQVHLEIDPVQYEGDETKFTALKDSDQARLEILKDILSNRLDIDCTRTCDRITYTPAYFLGRHELKMELVNQCKEVVDGTIDCGHVTMVFCGKNVDPGAATPSRLPVMVYACPSSFSTVEYFSTLDTEIIGRLVIYADVLKSSQYLLSKSIRHGLVVIARQQTCGIGRSNNTWLSPVGSACFSLQLHIPLSSPIGRMLTIVQHLVIVAIIEAIKKNPGYEGLDIGIKWPNDIYLKKSIKIGGLIVNSTTGNKISVLNIGCGVNMDNKEPTMCLNDYIMEYNAENNTKLKKLSHEKYFAMVFNELEYLYDNIQNDNLESFYNLYYKHWIHMNSQVTIQTEEGQTSNATIVGIDDFGFLKVRRETGEICVVQPDGNTFDMIKGLIVPKPKYK
ncbi:biotin--protein ligase [Coccinella septempunctata]|uniref:biotin--protein ligase n=1 Tax=Coccinella septempunctata TaxID=41139 RepID=UPI001D065351|nr:biotin--protein ligase [Coccinella septempunctata]XP_044762851.1 biotin--protein ligase [Coccinella septempunctata]